MGTTLRYVERSDRGVIFQLLKGSAHPIELTGRTPRDGCYRWLVKQGLSVSTKIPQIIGLRRKVLWTTKPSRQSVCLPAAPKYYRSICR